MTTAINNGLNSIIVCSLLFYLLSHAFILLFNQLVTINWVHYYKTNRHCGNNSSHKFQRYVAVSIRYTKKINKSHFREHGR